MSVCREKDDIGGCEGSDRVNEEMPEDLLSIPDITEWNIKVRHMDVKRKEKT